MILTVLLPSELTNLMIHHVHIFGASGSGTSTLGRAIASALPGTFLDTDDFYWKPTDPPFVERYSPSSRIEMIEKTINGQQDWVLSDSICSWGDRLLHTFTVAMFLYLDPSLRMNRLLQREQSRYGERILPDGDMYDAHAAFIAWARSYDTALAPTRSLDLHEAWIECLNCSVLRLDARHSVDELKQQVLSFLEP